MSLSCGNSEAMWWALSLCKERSDTKAEWLFIDWHQEGTLYHQLTITILMEGTGTRGRAFTRFLIENIWV